MRTKLKWIFAFAAGCWMLGEGARMVAMFVFHADAGWWYFPNTFDVFFDWLPLVILGTYFLVSSLLEYYKGAKAEATAR